MKTAIFAFFSGKIRFGRFFWFRKIFFFGRSIDFYNQKFSNNYERIDSLGGFTVKQVFLENGKFESYVNGENSLMHGTWKIAGKEVYVERKVSPTNPLGTGIVFNIEPDGNLTCIAEIRYRKQKNFQKDQIIVCPKTVDTISRNSYTEQERSHAECTKR